MKKKRQINNELQNRFWKLPNLINNEISQIAEIEKFSGCGKEKLEWFISILYKPQSHGDGIEPCK